LARTGKSKDYIIASVKNLGYDLSQPLFTFGRTSDGSCQGTIPKCMAIFNETNDFEDAIRTSIASGGDVDTIACIVGGIAQEK
jgi:ADP-ribosylglycohydrolase